MYHKIKLYNKTKNSKIRKDTKYEKNILKYKKSLF